MPFKMPTIPAVIGMVCAGVGLLFQIIGVATTGWQVIDIVRSEISIGLWKVCEDPGLCIDLKGDAVTDWLGACRAFGILGLLVLAGCLVVGILICFLEFDKLPLIAAILGFVSGFLILIEFAVYAGESVGEDYNYSFALTILACILGIVAGVCFILSKK